METWFRLLSVKWSKSSSEFLALTGTQRGSHHHNTLLLTRRDPRAHSGTKPNQYCAFLLPIYGHTSTSVCWRSRSNTLEDKAFVDISHVSVTNWQRKKLANFTDMILGWSCMFLELLLTENLAKFGNSLWPIIIDMADSRNLTKIGLRIYHWKGIIKSYLTVYLRSNLDKNSTHGTVLKNWQNEILNISTLTREYFDNKAILLNSTV